MVTSRWIRLDWKIFWGDKKSGDHCVRKSVSEGGFGSAPGFPILSDRDLSFSASLGVARCFNVLFSHIHIKTVAFDTRECGSPARATFIVDLSGSLRYMAAHRTDIPRCFILQAFSHSIVKFLLVKECDRDPSAGAGFPTLRSHWTCQSDSYAMQGFLKGSSLKLDI